MTVTRRWTNAQWHHVHVPQLASPQVCMWDVCKQGKSPCTANQVCVPDYCGRCGAK